MDRIVLFGKGERLEAVCKRIEHRHGIIAKYVPPVDVNEPGFVDAMAKLEPNLFIVAGWPHRFKPTILAVPKHGVWNCHGGPVPEYRGGSPLNWQMIDGKTEFGVTLLKMDEGLDTGPVIDEERFEQVLDTATIADAHVVANICFAEMVLRALDDFPPKLTQQPESKVYRRQRTDADGEIDFSWDGKRIHDFVRALTHPYPGAWFTAKDGSKVRIWSSSLENSPPSDASAPAAASPASATAN